MTQILKLALTVLILSATNLRAEITDLTGDIWSVCGWDGDSTWHDTRLVFTEQVTAKDGIEIAGYFDWASSGGTVGREAFRGTVDATGAVSLQGFDMQNSSADITTSRYTATLSGDGMTLLGGVWLDGLPGIWAAVLDGGRGTAVGFCETPTLAS